MNVFVNLLKRIKNALIDNRTKFHIIHPIPSLLKIICELAQYYMMLVVVQ